MGDIGIGQIFVQPGFKLLTKILTHQSWELPFQVKKSEVKELHQVYLEDFTLFDYSPAEFIDIASSEWYFIYFIPHPTEFYLISDQTDFPVSLPSPLLLLRLYRSPTNQPEVCSLVGKLKKLGITPKTRKYKCTWPGTPRLISETFFTPQNPGSSIEEHSYMAYFSYYYYYHNGLKLLKIVKNVKSV